MSETSEPDPEAAAVDRHDRVEFVRARLGEGTYLLELGRVERIADDPETARVPRSSPAIAGVATVGGNVVPVVDARTVVGLPPRPAEGSPTLLVLDRGGDAGKAGLLVDDVEDIDTYHVDLLAPVAEREDWQPEVGRQWFRAAVGGGTGGSVGVLDPRTIVAAAMDHTPDET